MTEKTYEGSGASSPSRGCNGGDGAPSFAYFSAFREIIREERETARLERETAATEQRCLMNKGFDLKLRLALREARQVGVAGVESRNTESRNKPRSSTGSIVQSSAVAEGCNITNFGGTSIGPSVKMYDPTRKFASTSRDERVGSQLNRPSPVHSHNSASSRRSGDSGAVRV